MTAAVLSAAATGGAAPFSFPFLDLAGGELVWTLVFAVFLCLLVVGWWRADRIDGAARQRQATRTEEPAPVPVPALTPDEAPADADRLLVGPPIVENHPTTSTGQIVPLRDWLVHFHATVGNIWSEVATEFYTAAMADPQIADFFRDSDRADLQKHFLAALITVTGGGITVGMVDRLRAQHTPVRNGRGEPISPAVFDRAADALVEVLRSKSVPERTLGQVDLVLACMRDAIAPSRDAVAGG